MAGDAGEMAGDAGEMAGIRIGELSRRTGMRPERLRAWERRYAILRPARTAGRFRLYGPEDEARVRAMIRFLRDGYSAAEAAGLVDRAAPAGDVGDVTGPPSPTLQAELAVALEAFDEERAQSVIDLALATFTVETVLTEMILPLLREVGERWERGEVTIDQEHFASSLIRGRLLGLARGWGRGVGPLAILACPPGEPHDLGLISFGLALRAQGWRIAYLGQDTPLDAVERAAASLSPELVVLASPDAERLEGLAGPLTDLAGRHRVALGGGATAAFAERVGALHLDGDPVSAAASAAVRAARG